jgi:hypothetical protein
MAPAAFMFWGGAGAMAVSTPARKSRRHRSTRGSAFWSQGSKDLASLVSQIQEPRLSEASVLPPGETPGNPVAGKMPAFPVVRAPGPCGVCGPRQASVEATSAIPQLVRSIPALALGPGIAARLTGQAAKL